MTADERHERFYKDNERTTTLGRLSHAPALAAVAGWLEAPLRQVFMSGIYGHPFPLSFLVSC